MVRLSAAAFPLVSEALGHVALYWLVLGRVAGALALSPVIGAAYVPNTLKGAVIAVVTLGLVPAVHLPAGGVPQQFAAYAALELREVVIGLAIGYISRLVVVAAGMAGDLLDLQFGFGITAVIDPLLGEPLPIIGTFFTLLTIVAFLLAGGDRLLIEALAASYTGLPIGGGHLLTVTPAAILGAFVWMFRTAIEIAAPLLGLMFLGTVMLALVGRAMPQVNLLMNGLPMLVMGGVLALMVMLPPIFIVMEQLAPRSLDYIGRLAGG